MKIGEILKIFRLINDIRSNDVADRICGTRSFVSSLESNRINPIADTIKRFAKVYKVDYGQIMLIQNRSEVNQWDYVKTIQEALTEWFKSNNCYMIILDEGDEINKIQIRNILKAFRIVRQKEFSDIKLKTAIRVSEIEKGRINLSFEQLIALADVYDISAAKILEIHKKSVEGMWNFQRILYEVAVVCKE